LIAVSSLWSTGWILFFLWRDVVDKIQPIPMDYFSAPALVLAPWLIWAAIIATKWVMAGFK
jgi:hypothetical protein